MVKDGLRRSNFWVNDLTSDNSISGASINATAATITTGTITNATISNAEVPLVASKGITVTNIKAEVVISGGMWVVGSAASGTSPNIVAKPATVGTAASNALGIALATVASGAEVSVLTQGTYKGLIAADTIVAGEGFVPGSGAAINSILPATTGKSLGVAVMGAGSGGETLVYLR
jgi:hypothetical protein